MVVIVDVDGVEESKPGLSLKNVSISKNYSQKRPAPNNAQCFLVPGSFIPLYPFANAETPTPWANTIRREMTEGRCGEVSACNISR